MGRWNKGSNIRAIGACSVKGSAASPFGASGDPIGAARCSARPGVTVVRSQHWSTLVNTGQHWSTLVGSQQLSGMRGVMTVESERFGADPSDSCLSCKRARGEKGGLADEFALVISFSAGRLIRDE